MHGKVAGPISPAMEKAMHTLRAAYDMNKHTDGDSAQAATLTPEFIDAYAIVGPPDICLLKLEALAKLGLDKIAASGGLAMHKTPDGQAARALMAAEVLPAAKPF